MKDKETRRTEAESRKSDRDSRTPDQQIELAQSRPGSSKKEIARLTRLTKETK